LFAREEEVIPQDRERITRKKVRRCLWEWVTIVFCVLPTDQKNRKPESDVLASNKNGQKRRWAGEVGQGDEQMGA